jgi:hypothetical protein
MPTRFCTNTWLAVKTHWDAVCKKCKSFANNAINLQKMQTASESLKSKVIWRKNRNVYTAYKHGMKMHVLFVSKTNDWMWQIGNNMFYERAHVSSHDTAVKEVLAVANGYREWDGKPLYDMFSIDVSWQKDANGGVIGSWQDFDLWIAPVDDMPVPSLWRYDIYRANDTKSVRSGVARSQFDARKFCVRSTYVLSHINLTN